MISIIYLICYYCSGVTHAAIAGIGFESFQIPKQTPI